jgi:TusA-related sulfurtransferase
MSPHSTNHSELAPNRAEFLSHLITHLQSPAPGTASVANAFFQFGSAKHHNAVTEAGLNLSASYCFPSPLSDSFCRLSSRGEAILATTEIKLLERLELLLNPPKDLKSNLRGSIYDSSVNRKVVASLLKEFTTSPLNDGVIFAQQIPDLFKTYWERMTNHEECPMPLLKVISSYAPLETRIFISVLSQVYQSQHQNPFFAISQLTSEQVDKVSTIVKKYEELIQQTTLFEVPFAEKTLTCNNISLTPERVASQSRQEFFEAIALAQSEGGRLSNYFHSSSNPKLNIIGEKLAIGKSLAFMAFELSDKKVAILTQTEAAMLSVLQMQAEPQTTQLTFELLNFFEKNHRSQFNTLEDVACYCRQLAEIKIEPQHHRELYRAIRKELPAELRASILMLQFSWERNEKSAFLELAKFDLEKLPKIQALTRELLQEVKEALL